MVVTEIPNKLIGHLVLEKMGYSTEKSKHIMILSEDQFPMYIHNKGIRNNTDWSHGQNYAWVKSYEHVHWKKFLKGKGKVTVTELLSIIEKMYNNHETMRRKIKTALDLSGYY